MDRYNREDAHEREPLDAYHNRPDQEFHDQTASNQYYRPDPSYYDTLPRQDVSPSRVSNTRGRWNHETEEGDDAPPPPPQHGGQNHYSGRGTSYRGSDMGYSRPVLPSNVTPGADNFSDSAAGGMAGIAHSVAERNSRQSGMEAMRSTGQVPPPPSRSHYRSNPPRSYSPSPSGNSHSYGGGAMDRDSHSSLNAPGPSAQSHASRSPSRAPYNVGNESYIDDPYQEYYAPRNGEYRLGIVDPNDIEDDGDDGLVYSKHSQRNSMLSLSRSDRGGKHGIGLGATAGGGGFLGRRAPPRGDPEYDLATGREKNSGWHSKQKSKSKKWKWAVIILVLLLIVGGVVGGVVGALLNGNKANTGGDKHNGQSAKDDLSKNGDLDLDSSEIKHLLDNPDLHRVFPGMDYTPLNTQYPDCMHDPPSQNNVTRDVAVLSQLTNKIRLYGTDCNQTQMVIHSLRQLKMTDDIKIWMGVWQNDNKTTNDRQLKQMWSILDEYGEDPFEGIIVANEIIFRKEMTVDKLGTLLESVRTNLSDNGLSLPVATSDLGDDWTDSLSKDSDYLMANIHPFFSGTPADKAADWTNDFWKKKDGEYFKSNSSRNIISETGWPTSGGTSCGSGSPGCKNGAVAGIDELNQFMKDWVCDALEKKTQYFWFEAFDEPWKIRFNEKGKNWEDKWGLLDINRNLKDGVKIPDCGGKTV